ncbi:GAF domain-containing protein, partial [bacterium]|nr:GAF domain-containing protein [bacterium]
MTRTTCRAGLPCYIAPVAIENGPGCAIVIGGFVSATRERKLLFEKLLGRSVPEEQARIVVREIPILPLHQVEALVRVLQVNASTLLEAATRDNASAVRQRELETIVEAGNEFAERRGMGPDLLEAVLARAMAIVSADSGSLMLVRPGTDFLEVVVPHGESVAGARGHLLRIGEGIAGRVAQTGRSVLVTGDSEELLALSTHPGRGIAASVSVPLMREGRVLGVLNLNIGTGAKGLSGDDLILVERYAHLAALTIDNARAHGATKRAMFELMHLGELAKTLSGATDLEQIV